MLYEMEEAGGVVVGRGLEGGGARMETSTWLLMGPSSGGQGLPRSLATLPINRGYFIFHTARGSLVL